MRLGRNVALAVHFLAARPHPAAQLLVRNPCGVAGVFACRLAQSISRIPVQSRQVSP